ncbi:MAG: TonB-dependent siderophore receptor [Steroidobacteraceae bacterium]
MKTSLRLLAACGAGLAFSLAGAAAFAADSPDSGESVETVRKDVNGIPAIIVTAKRYVPDSSMSANKSDIPLIQTPQSVSVITRDQIDLLNFVDAQQAVRYAAGVQGENYGPDLRFDFLTVRGFTPKQYIDGLAAPISTAIYSVGVDLYNFESFDVLKGPASVLYGNAPPGGIYNQTSRRASSQFGGEFGVKYGTDQFKEGFGTVTGALSDSVSARFTALYLDRDAERDYVKAKRFLVAPTLTWKIAESTSLTGLFYYQHDEVRGDTNGFLPVYGTLLPNPVGRVSQSVNLGDPNNLYKRRQYAVGWDFSHRFSDAVGFRSNFKWGRYRERTPTGVYGGGGLIEITDPTSPDYYRTVQQYNFSYAEDVDSTATDNRFDFKLATGSVQHKLLTGIDFRRVANLTNFGFVFGNTIDLFNPVYLPQPTPEPGYPFNYNNETLKQTGLYAQDQLQFGDLYLALGGRYDKVKIRNAIAAPVTETDQHQFTYRVGLNYVMPTGVAPYVSYATSFEPVLGNDSITGAQFKPSKGKQIEAGVKYDARNLGEGVKLLLTAAVFQIKQTNVVSTEPSITPVFGTQSGEVESKGGEIEFVARFHDQLAINGSYSYNKTEVTKSATPEEIGSPLSTSPKNKLSLFVDYTLQTGALGGLGFGFGGRYNSDSAGSLPGPFNPVVYFGESATLFDAIVHYDTPGWRIALNGSNIFDKRYVARCSGAAGCTYGAGMQFIGTVTRKF